LSKFSNYSPGITVKLDSITNNKNNLIIISLDAYFLTKPSEVLLISEIRSGDKVIDWRSTPFTDFISNVNERQTVFHPIKLPDINIDSKDATLSIVIWNKSKAKVLIDDFKVTTYEGNKVIYGQFEKL